MLNAKRDLKRILRKKKVRKNDERKLLSKNNDLNVDNFYEIKRKNFSNIGSFLKIVVKIVWISSIITLGIINYKKISFEYEKNTKIISCDSEIQENFRFSFNSESEKSCEFSKQKNE